MMTNSRWTVTPSWQPLFALWRELMAQPQLPFLDRWLKQQFKKPLSSSRGPAQVELGQQLLLSRALMEAMAFIQLACAMEKGFLEHMKNPEGDGPDWQQWDQDWFLEQVKSLPMSCFWHWVALRTGMDAAEIRVAEKDERAAYCAAWQARVSAAPLSFESLLWFGFRPQWQSLLAERVHASGWSEAQLLNFQNLQTQMPPLWLRPQRGMQVAELAQLLNSEGVNAHLTANGYVCANGGKGVANTQLYRDGMVEIQDLASQQIAEAVAVKPGQKVWDACAGAGGKALAIGSRMNNKGVLVATDLHDYKLDELKRRAKRAELFNIRTFVWDGAAPLRLPKEVAQQKGFDWVLIDAPCSSSGTWRRNPDARWRFDARDTQELLHIQTQILTQAAPAVRVGGHLVYASCSWQVSENEGQVAEFLRANPQFTLVKQLTLGAPEADSDTMFVATLVRNN